jgi:transmembrane sensor
MPPHPSDHRHAPLPTSAEAWLARLLAEDCTTWERQAFERWRHTHPDHDAAYRELEALWQQSSALAQLPDVDALIGPPVRPRRRQRWMLPVAAAATVLLAFAATLIQPWKPLPLGERVATVTGQQQPLTLPDGSTVLLDAQTVLRVRYSDATRALILTRGQAQFDVKPDPQRPFEVRAENGTVRALGTSFQVRVAEEDVTVTLLEGKVAVEVAGLLGTRREETLVPGEQVRYALATEPLAPKAPADLEVVEAWPRGDLVFKGWRLDRLVREMNRYSEAQLHLGDPALSQLTLSGRFHAGDYRTMLRVLESEWPIVAVRNDEGDIVLSQRR